MKVEYFIFGAPGDELSLRGGLPLHGFEECFDGFFQIGDQLFILFHAFLI
jgi:hypothetical protein